MKIADSVCAIEMYAFSSGHKLKEVLFGTKSNLEFIYDYAFDGCINLTGITIPKSVTYFGTTAFYECNSLTISGYNPVAKEYSITNGITYIDLSTTSKSTIKLSAKTATYTGKAISIGKAKVTGSEGKVTYTYYTNSKCTKKTTSANGASKKGGAPKYTGTYYVKATVAADTNYKSATSKAVKLVINKAKATLKVKTLSKPYKKATVAKKAQTFAIGVSVTGKGTLSYTKVSGSKALTINKKNGKITIAKKTRAGTYKIKVKISAKASTNYKAASKTVTITVKVK